MRPVLRAVVAAVALPTVLGGLVAGMRYINRLPAARDQERTVCPLLQHGPLGDASSCRAIGHEPHVFGDAELSVYALVGLPSGPAAIRVDYADVTTGARTTADAVEVDPGDAPGLSDAEARAAGQAVSARGGLHTQRWRVIFGDG